MTQNIDTTQLRYSLLLNSDDYITIFTPERVRKFVNPAYCDLFKKTSDQLIGTKFTDDFPEEKKKFYNEFITGMTPSTPTISATRLGGVPGEERWISWKETGIYDTKGKLLEILSVGRDVNSVVETRKEKEQLIATLSAFKQAIDTNIICTITDAKGIITYANDKFCKISQFSREELEGKTHSIVNSNFHPKSFFVNMWRTITNGDVWSGEIKNKAKDGTYYWVQSAIIPVKDDKNNISGYLSLRILIDERKKLEEERAKYLRSLENMLYIVSHEIRRPITTCQGLLHIMQEGVPKTSEEYFEVVTHLYSSASELDDYSRKLNEYLQTNIKNVQ